MVLLLELYQEKASPTLTKRCEQLVFDINITDCKNKLPKLRELEKLYGISSMQMAICDDDVLGIPECKAFSCSF